MKYFFGIIFSTIIFLGCNNPPDKNVHLPNGIYFVAENSDTGTVRMVYHLSDSLPNDTSSVVIFTKTIISDKNLYWIFLRKDSKDGLLFNLNQEGLEKVRKLQMKNKNQKVVLVLDGEIVGMSDLSKPESGQDFFDVSPLGNKDSI